MQADLQTLKRIAFAAADRSALRSRIEDIVFDPGKDEWGSDILRVRVRMKRLDEIDDGELVDLKRAIRDDVSDLDERFPAVRFSDAD